MARYEYRHGLRSTPVKAEAAYTELERIRAAHDDKLNPRDIVEESRPNDAVLHSFFEWDDAVAAEEHRVLQARRLSRSVYIVTPATKTRPSQESPVYFHVEPNNYQPASVLIRQADMFTLALQALTTKLAGAERAVAELKQLAERGKDPDRLAAIALAVQGFEAVRAAVAAIR